MRWIAAQTVLVLLMCTVFSCTALALPQKPLPPCHQHQKPAAPQSASPCDHQQAVSVEMTSLELPDAVWPPAAVSAAPVLVSLPCAEILISNEHPPGQAIPSSVLRV